MALNEKEKTVPLALTKGAVFFMLPAGEPGAAGWVPGPGSAHSG